MWTPTNRTPTMRSHDRVWSAADGEGLPMKKSLLSGIAALTAAALLGAGLAACAPPEKRGGGEQTQSGVKAADATSAKDFGGMDGLVDAAKKEGELNVYSDDGQNLNAAGGVRPVRADGMLAA